MLKGELALLAMVLIDASDRAREDYKDMEGLKESIQHEGLIQPICVMDTQDGKYKLLAGGRRFRACTELGMQEISCNIFPYTDDVREQKLIELVENIQREDLTYVERAKLTKQIHDVQVEIKGKPFSSANAMGGHTMADTGKMLGKSKSKVHRELELAKAIEKYPELAKCKNEADAMKKLSDIKEGIILKEIAKRAVKPPETKKEESQKELIDRYIVGDSVETMNNLIQQGVKVDLVEIDPPYAIPFEASVKRGKMSFDEEELDTFFGRDLTKEDVDRYLTLIRGVVKAGYKLLKPNGWILLWLAPEPWLQPFYEILKEEGFEGDRMLAIWVKPNGAVKNPYYKLASCYESFFYMHKGSPMLAKGGRSNVFAYPTPQKDRFHPTERSVELYMEIFKTFCQPGSTIISAFAGSGNVLLAADNAGMTALGCDLNPDYKEHYIARIYQQTRGKYTSF